jgi:hypothetical protein
MWMNYALTPHYRPPAQSVNAIDRMIPSKPAPMRTLPFGLTVLNSVALSLHLVNQSSRYHPTDVDGSVRH